MSIFSKENSLAALRVEAVVYGAAVALLGVGLLATAPLGRAPGLLVLAALGLLLWSLTEYLLHRFVQHRMEPFARWHLQHHSHSTTLAGLWVTGLSLVAGAALLGVLLLLPVWWLLGPLHTSALALGLFTGYLGYTLTHHAVHLAALRDTPQQADGFDWMQHSTVWHARHHQIGQPCCYGISTTLWDRVFGTSGQSH